MLAAYFLLIGVSLCLAESPCPKYWTQYEESCYFLHVHDKYSWPSAKSFCEDHPNGHLAYVTSSEENTFIKGMVVSNLSSVSNAHVWLGATDEVHEGDFLWYKVEEPLTFTDWGPGEPNSGPLHLIEDCLVMWHHYHWQWADLDCHQECFFVCEMPMRDQGEVVVG